jgi:glycosyltransferase involved in cell wall biosynthesis
MALVETRADRAVPAITPDLGNVDGIPCRPSPAGGSGALRILYIDHYAGSPSLGMEFRPYYLAREWVRGGHAVRVVGADYSHLRSRQPAATPRAPALEDGVEYTWLPTPRYRGNGVGRVLNIAAFLLRLRLRAHALLHETRPDVVIASSTYPMDIWLARHLARRSGARLVFELHDVWPASPIELGGMSPRHPFIRLCAKAERVACRDADLVVSILPAVGPHLQSLGLEPSKLHVVPNGIDPAEWDGAGEALDAAVATRVRAAREAGRLVVGYAGAHGLPNALDTLLDAAAMLKAEPFEFVLVGDGHEKARLERRVANERLERVALFTPLPKRQVPALLAAFDVAYIGWRRLPIYRFGIAANKLMDYMMGARPILHAVAAANDPVAEAGCGVSVAPESAGALAEGLRRLHAMDVATRSALGARGREWVLAHRTWPLLARRFLEAVQVRASA